MPIRIRAKFQCQEETRKAWNLDSRTYRFGAIYDPDIPEDRRYAKATPSGSAELLVDNPSARFDVGRYYYLEFVPVDDVDQVDDGGQ